MRLRHAQFYGRFDARCDVAGFSLACMSAQPAAHRVVPHEHDDGHFILVLDGCYRSTARGAADPLGPGDLLWNPPGTRHQDRFSSAEGRFLALSLPAPQAAALGLVAGGARRLQGAARAQALRLSARPSALDLGALLQTETLCRALCALASGEAVPEVSARGPGAPRWLLRCMERLVDDCPQPHRLGDLALEAGVHPVSLARAFRHHFGLSPGQLQRRAQLNRAAALLRHGTAVAEAAAACGFADQSHFTRAFRAEYRCTPAVWQAGFRPSGFKTF